MPRNLEMIIRNNDWTRSNVKTVYTHPVYRHISPLDTFQHRLATGVE